MSLFNNSSLMSSSIINENFEILSQKRHSKIFPYQLSLSSPKSNLDDSNIDNNNPYERLKIIEEIINNKNEEINNLNIKLEKIEKIQKRNIQRIQKPLTYSKKQEMLEDNKIKDILNSKNISLRKKLYQISQKVEKIEAELLYGSGSNLIPFKEKLKEMKSKKEYILLKMNENDNEIKKIENKEEKDKYKEKQKNFLENLSKIQEEKKSAKSLIKEKLLLLTDNNINVNEAFNKSLREEEIQKRIEEQKIKELKYKELREIELQKIKKRKQIIKLKNERYNNNNWIDAYTNRNNHLSWDAKEKERIRKEESLILLENNKRKIYYSPISSEELNQFSNEVMKKQLENKNELKKRKNQLEELWKERKKLLPEHKSIFEIRNIKSDNDSKEEDLLKKKQINENILEKINFSLDVSKNYRPKLVNEKLKKERIEKINDLKGINRKKEIKDLGSRLKLKAIKLVKNQPRNFKINNIFKIEDTVAEQQAKKLLIKKEKSDENLINEEDKKNDRNNDLTNEVKYWKRIINNKGDIFSFDENIIDKLNEEKNKYKIKIRNIKKVNNSTGSPDFIYDNLKKSHTNRLMEFRLKKEHQNINSIKNKLKKLNEYIEE